MVLLVLSFLSTKAQGDILQFVFTSDVHYGITRPHFRGLDSVSSTMVNQAMIAAINRLPEQTLPMDSGVAAGQRILSMDAIIITGDIANREEKGIQSAATSWQQFEGDYGQGIGTKDRNNRPTPLWLCPGNHDVSNAIGYWKPTEPATDASSMAGMYNMMISPTHPKSAAEYNYATNKINFSRDIGGIHLIFLQLWPDSTAQQWMERDLKGLRAGTPVLLFVHSQPDVEARFFTNPNGRRTIDSTDKFENLLPEMFKDGKTIKDTALDEQRGLAAFLQRHPAIRAYFHGHNNWNEFYRWTFTGSKVSLPCFRVDSPMKGKFSAQDETRLSFQLISIDARTKTMTVRECRWNTVPGHPGILKWGDQETIAL